MTDDQGRSRPVSSVAADNAILLIRMFLEDRAFAEEAQQVTARFQDWAATGLGLDHQDVDWAQVSVRTQELAEILLSLAEEVGVKRSADTQISGQHFDARELKELAEDARTVGERFGLKAPWVGYSILQQELVHSNFSAIWHEQNPSAADVWVDPRVSVQARYSPLKDKRDDVERDIHAQIKDQLDAIDRRWSRAGIGRQKKRPAVEQHVRWLFLRIRDPKTATWAKIAKDSKVGDRTVRDAVESLARDLNVELPLIPPGRPRKLRN